MNSGDISRKKLTSPVLLLIHSIPVRDRIDNEHDVPVRSVSLGSFISHGLYSLSYRNIGNHLFGLPERWVYPQ